MKKTAIPLLLALITTACSAKDDFSGEYQRLKASEFEVKHNMNTSASIAHKDGQYLVVMRSGYGEVSHAGKVVDGKLVLDSDLVAVKDKDMLKIFYTDAPEVVFMFKQK